MEQGAKSISVLQTPLPESMGQVSPDGRWIAYMSLSRSWEMYVRPFTPDTGGGATGAKWLVSQGSGLYPRWRADGRELLYTTVNLLQMAVDIDTRKGFQYGTPRQLFAVPPPLLDVGWDLAPAGKRFLYLAAPGGGRTIPFTVVLNWAAALKK